MKNDVICIIFFSSPIFYLRNYEEITMETFVGRGTPFIATFTELPRYFRSIIISHYREAQWCKTVTFENLWTY